MSQKNIPIEDVHGILPPPKPDDGGPAFPNITPERIPQMSDFGEPWDATKARTLTHVKSRDGRYIAEFRHADEAAWAVACVNFCRGLDTSALEPGGAENLIEALREAEAANSKDHTGHSAIHGEQDVTVCEVCGHAECDLNGHAPTCPFSALAPFTDSPTFARATEETQ